MKELFFEEELTNEMLAAHEAFMTLNVKEGVDYEDPFGDEESLLIFAKNTSNDIKKVVEKTKKEVA